MKFTATLNGVKVTKEIPTSWDQVTFRQYLDLVDVQNSPQDVLAAFVGVDVQTLSKVKIVGLDAILHCLAFVKVPPALNVPKEIKGFKVSKNLEFETTGQFKDAESIVQSMKTEGGNLPKEDQLKYLDLVAIFAMPNYMDAEPEEQQEFAQQFMDAPCGEVLAIGNFTLLKLIGLKLNINPDSLSKPGPLKRLRLVIKIWQKNLAFSLRYAWLKRKLA